ncbi:MAG: hypothetical protein GFH27_549361n16 [Chloroflexi bacterium AL-W]|nr:hypothetical protein [Chloroflexi bacterium AL-N1]NOK70728.1 hypothetical protein [Chloroflexi bacterium AL-N10]NOK78288.1 hypothetical protein [Chloroflexi bacterium AL-N5]NOK85631.1 hypothetical protein [Chloroflexi bacterium AL-W]NOK92545.1 hypothetical protein [Chloroflexi bacterium AL-N15]
MGFEYTIRFVYESQDKLDKLLRQCEGFTDVEPMFGGYQYRSSENQGIMPDAEVRIQDAGVYFCDYGASGARVLRDLVAQLLAEYNEVTIAKLDWE